ERVEKRSEGILLDERPGPAAEIEAATVVPVHGRSEERRVGKECKSRWAPDHEKKKREPERIQQVERGHESEGCNYLFQLTLGRVHCILQVARRHAGTLAKEARGARLQAETQP